MTIEEIMAYAEKVKQNNRDYNARHYNNTIKTDPEKYELWKHKCKVANKKYYDKKNGHTIST